MSVREQERQARQAERKAQEVLRACDGRCAKLSARRSRLHAQPRRPRRRIEVGGGVRPRPLLDTRTAPRRSRWEAGQLGNRGKKDV